MEDISQKSEREVRVCIFWVPSYRSSLSKVTAPFGQPLLSPGSSDSFVFPLALSGLRLVIAPRCS